MSIDIMNRLWWRDDLPTMVKFVGLALGDAAGDTGVCWPAIATIARKCSCSERTVQNALGSLEKKMLIRRIVRKDRSSYYVFNLDHLPLIERPQRFKEKGLHEDLMTGESPAPDLFGTGESGSMTGESGSMTGESPAPRTVIEPSLEPPDRLSGDLASPARSLSDFVEEEWAKLKADFPRIAGIRKIDDGLRHTIELRGKQHARDGETPLDVWREFLQTIGESRFLCGLAPPGPGRDKHFTLTLAWATTAAHFREILGGKYNGDRDASLYGADGRRLGPSGAAVSRTVARLRSARERGGGHGDHDGAR